MMKLLIIFLLGLALVVAFPTSFSDKVQISVRKLSKRSVGEKPSVSVRVKGEAHDYTFNLQSPSVPIFGHDFSYSLVTEEGGSLVLLDDTPSVELLDHIQNRLFVDTESNSVLSIKGSEDDQYDLTGIISNKAIVPVPVHGSPKERVYELLEQRSSFQPEFSDYIDLHRNITAIPPKARASPILAQPELWVVVDYENAAAFGFDRTQILDYLGVFFHAVNNRFATSEDPAISFRISAVTIISTKAAQPFIEAAKTPDGSGYDIQTVLDKFAKWTFTTSSPNKFDMAALLTGLDLQNKESSGAYSKGVAGLAYLKSACWRGQDRFYSTSVSEEKGGTYSGVFTVAHELAHNLGAPHDGSGEAAACSWNDGHIMSYLGWGTPQKFQFSQCSRNLMKAYIASQQGSCVNSLQAGQSPAVPISSQNVGDRLNMGRQCVLYTGQAAAIPEAGRKPDDLCKNLVCRYPTPGKPKGYFTITTLNRPAGDNTPCGTSGGKCVEGTCVPPSG